jgi:hypothetical protein
VRGPADDLAALRIGLDDLREAGTIADVSFEEADGPLEVVIVLADAA